MKATDYGLVVVWSEQDQAYLAQAIDLPGCIADGETREEAVANAVDVIQDWIDTAKELGREVPPVLSHEDYERISRKVIQQTQADFKKALEDAVQKALSEMQAFQGRFHYTGLADARTSRPAESSAK